MKDWLLLAAILFACFWNNCEGKRIIPYWFPLFKQCDTNWGNDIMVTKTICEVGCLMSSISMALNGRNISISEIKSNPGVLNTWLKHNSGYDNDNGIKMLISKKKSIPHH